MVVLCLGIGFIRLKGGNLLDLIFCHDCRKKILIKNKEGKTILYLVHQWNGRLELTLMRIISEKEHNKEYCPFCAGNNIQEDRNHKTLARLEKQV